MAFKTEPTIRLEAIVKAEPVVYRDRSTAVDLEVTCVSFLGAIDPVYFTEEGLRQLLKRGFQLSCREPIPLSIDDKVMVYTTEELVNPELPTMGSPKESVTDVLPLSVKHKGQVYSFEYPC